MTNNNDDGFEDDTPLEKALEGVADYEVEVDLDPHLKRALRHLTQSADELKTAMRKRGLFPIGKH
ncbi:hypothetical protein [Flavisericum labens]|uniref:hypothetical protein n=1 Tax=Flavisericum labens TaxID=3377112 RepID=UPI00387B0AE5